jgi:acyl dehydratase
VNAAARGRYLEDFVVGERRELGSRRMEEDAILAFGRAFDPQAFHVDPEAAKESFFGGLVASGWHTACTMMRIVVDAALGDAPGGFVGSPGFEDLRFAKPVRPGDTLHVTSTIEAVTPSATKVDRGVVSTRYEVRNQDGVVVLSMLGKGLYLRRSA